MQQDKFEFCDVSGQRYSVVYTIPPKVSRLGPLRTVDIGAFQLSAERDAEPTVPERFVMRATHIEHTSIPAFTSVGVLKDELYKQL